MNFVPTRSLYAGPRLQDAADIDAWKVTFLAAAEAMGLRGYYETAGFEDPRLAERISPAKMHLIQSKAEASEPEIVPGTTDYSLAHSERNRRVQARVAVVVSNECTGLRAREERFAVRYLLSAVEKSLHADLEALNGPAAMWHYLESLTRATEPSLFAALQTAMTTKLRPTECASDFVARFEPLVCEYVDGVVSVEPNGDAARGYCRAVADRLRSSFFGHALPPSMVDHITAWQQSQRHSTYANFKQRLHEHLRDAAPDAPADVKADSGPGATPATSHDQDANQCTTREPTPRVFCMYCHSKKHVDGYVLPAGSSFPLLSMNLCKPNRRFCSYCQSTKHRDLVCDQLVDDVRRGSVRPGYSDPYGQLLTTDADLVKDEPTPSEAGSNDTEVSAVTGLPLVSPSSSESETEALEISDTDSGESQVSQSDDDDVVVTHHPGQHDAE
ncbi:hypothetical protein ACHHYP_20389 [Achlya hypogyna]|uniref:Uncharacterized protein n=1 Tax=Achlya hypogyna TaxID=1202772 RepID=A0A1V9ZJV2_ACHHY|nr:hypothetical protein ACHHYP_20389 [Achlya hypogyna]